jgi:hypothetical protein
VYKAVNQAEISKFMSEETQFEYDVAFSFAGEDRVFVEEVAAQLHRRRVKVFYDRYEQADLWGKDLYVHLDEVYRKKARYCLMFLSRHYASKLWTSHERRSAQARAMAESSEYILPVRLDSSEVPGFLPTIGYITSVDFPPTAIAELVAEKLRGSRKERAVADAVGLFLDFEYLWHALKGLHLTTVGSALAAYARRFGDLQCLWASVESGIPGRHDVANGLVRAGFSLTTSTKRGRSDFALLERITEETIRGQLRTFILVSGDGDFLDKIMSLLLLGHVVRLVADSHSMNARYRNLAKERQNVRHAVGFQDTDFFIDELQAALSPDEL